MIEIWNETTPSEKEQLEYEKYNLEYDKYRLGREIKRLRKALQAIMDSTQEDFPSLEGISLIAYMALNGDDND